MKLSSFTLIPSRRFQRVRSLFYGDDDIITLNHYRLFSSFISGFLEGDFLKDVTYKRDDNPVGSKLDPSFVDVKVPGDSFSTRFDIVRESGLHYAKLIEHDLISDPQNKDLKVDELASRYVFMGTKESPFSIRNPEGQVVPDKDEILYRFAIDALLVRT